MRFHRPLDTAVKPRYDIKGKNGAVTFANAAHCHRSISSCFFCSRQGAKDEKKNGKDLSVCIPCNILCLPGAFARVISTSCTHYFSLGIVIRLHPVQ